MGAVKKVNSFLTMESENYEGTMGIVLSIIFFHLNVYLIQMLAVCQTYCHFCFCFPLQYPETPMSS